LELLHARVAETLAVVEREQQALDERERKLANAASEPVATSPAYVLLVPGGRYRLVERDDGPPNIGTEILGEQETYRIVRLGSSPLPNDRRRCAFVERLTQGSDL